MSRPPSLPHHPPGRVSPSRSYLDLCRISLGGRNGNARSARGVEGPSSKQGVPVNVWLRAGLSALISGATASVASTAALALLAKAEGKSPLQPTNATSHWLHGESAGHVRRADLAHTGVGYLTH